MAARAGVTGAGRAASIGAEAAELVYLYASCDRPATYPGLADPEAPFHDRFTGTTTLPAPQARRDFAELPAANELDLAGPLPGSPEGPPPSCGVPSAG
ncbi:hypothetical protein ACFC63_10560 [Streptomyces albidoflavus]